MAKSLEAKYKQVHDYYLNILYYLTSEFGSKLVKTTKPTGDAECPPQVERAHEIEDLINEKVSTRDLDDAEIVDGAEDVIELR
jgi:hypothetical protein